MKKNMVILIISLFIMFGLNIVTAEAVTCTYGIKEENGSWNKQFTFDIGAWNAFEINGALSPYITGQNVYDFKMVSNKDYIAKGKFKQADCLLKYSESIEDSNVPIISDIAELWSIGWEGTIASDYTCPDDELYVYASLYPTQSVYTSLEGKCPPYLKYEVYHENLKVDFLKTKNIYHVKIYNDDLDYQKLKTDEEFDIKLFNWLPFIGGKEIDWFTEEGALSTEGKYVLEEYKDMDMSELVDDYDCVTYSTMMSEIEKTVEEKGSCDNNEEFNKRYRELQSLCDSFRSSALYTSSDSSDGVKTKSCATACSMLKDDVAVMCDAAPANQFCGTLGGKLVGWVFKIVSMARYFVPVVLILLSVLDYIKAIASDSEDEMKKASGRFVKRLIAGALIFIIPFILDFILKWFDIPGLDPNNPFCAK